MRRAAVAVCLLLAGCGLPLQDGVQRPGPAVERAAQPGEVDVLPPDPRPDADALAVVEDFVGAQSSPQGDHAIARKYLAEGVVWDDDEARVFDPAAGTRATEVSPGVVQVRYAVVGRVRRDGTWLSGARTEVAVYKLARFGQTWRLTEVPSGLHLTPGDRDRSFRLRNVHFLAATSTAGRLVAEPVYQPVTADPAQALVERLLAGPSLDLAPAVRSAAPAGTQLAAPVRVDGGTITVELEEGARGMGRRELRELSAQLVWTLRALPAFTTLRLRAGGEPLLVDGREEQRRDAHDESAPDGLPPAVALTFVRGGLVRSAAAGVLPGERPLADDVAVSPTGDRLAVLARRGSTTTITTGPAAGPADQQVRRGLVTSPSWGSGEQGLWFLEDGRLRLLPLVGTAVRDVPVAGRGELTSVAVSRDGARVALVRGGELLIGRIEVVDGGLRVAGLRAVAPVVQRIRDVVWFDATRVVVLGDAPVQDRIPVTVSVDGASVVPNTALGVDGEPTSIAAAAGRELVVGAGPQLYAFTGRVFVERTRGTSPSYPG